MSAPFPPEIMVSQIHGATLSPDGKFLVIDMADLEHPDRIAVRLGIPAAHTAGLIEQLQTLEKAMADPQSGIRWTPPH